MMKQSEIKDTSLAYYELAEAVKLYKISIGSDADEVRVIFAIARGASKKEPKYHDKITVVDLYGVPERESNTINIDYVPRVMNTAAIIDIIAAMPAEEYAGRETMSEDGCHSTCNFNLPDIIDLYS